jgi:hypothetical protein
LSANVCLCLSPCLSIPFLWKKCNTSFLISVFLSVSLYSKTYYTYHLTVYMFLFYICLHCLYPHLYFSPPNYYECLNVLSLCQSVFFYIFNLRANLRIWKFSSNICILLTSHKC